MLRRLEKVKQKILNESAFYLAGVLFACIMLFIHVGRDDIGSMHLDGGTLSMYWGKAVEMYWTWSSRVLVNFTVFVFTDQPVIVWAVFMGVSMFVLGKALSILFVRHNTMELNWLIVCLILSYPFQNLSSAGWIATMTTYFSPIAFGFMSVVPIKKIYDGERFQWWEYAVYAVCLIYGANNEQMMVVIFAAYVSAAVYFVYKKKYSFYCFFLLFLSGASMVFVLTCAGNQARKSSEISAWFPTFGMLTMLDKADLGIFTALKWLLFQNYFIILFSGLLAVLLWKKYEVKWLRTLSLLPIFITALAGPLQNVGELLYPSLKYLSGDISIYGLVTAENRGESFVKYIVLASLAFLLIFEIFMVLYDFADFAAAMIFILSGFASRAVLGFSPTIFASGNRTCAVMGFCVLASVVLVYVRSVEKGLLSMEIRKKVLFAAKWMTAISFLDLWIYAAVTIL